MERASSLKRLTATFFRHGVNEPVREWLRSLDKEERTIIGSDIRTIEYGWPVGMPTCRPLGDRLFEVRSSLKNRIARVLFVVEDGRMILLHGFIKKDQRTPDEDIAVGRERLRQALRAPRLVAFPRK